MHDHDPLASSDFKILPHRPMDGERARQALDCHSPINAVAGAISFIKRAGRHFEPVKASSDDQWGDAAPERDVFLRTRSRLYELLSALQDSREKFQKVLKDGVDPQTVMREEAEALGDELKKNKAALMEVEWAQDVCRIIRERVLELVERWRLGDTVIRVRKDEMAGMLTGVLTAIAHESQGRESPFKIVTDPAAPRNPGDYLFSFDLIGPDGKNEADIPEILRDVIRDLTCNARKYSKPGSEFSTDVREYEEFLVIRVRDQGIGVPMEAYDKLGEYGFRAVNAQRSANGHGFGLTKAIQVAHEWRGYVEFRSKSGVGTEFRVVIPKPYALRPDAHRAPTREKYGPFGPVRPSAADDAR